MKNISIITMGAAFAALTALASCSEEDAGTAAPDDGAIRFAANTEYGSRAADVTTGNLSEFSVFAYTGAAQTLFMDNVKVTKSASNVWTYSPIKYWPAENVDFYAYAPGAWVGATGPL